MDQILETHKWSVGVEELWKGSVGRLATVTTFKRQQTIVFKVRIVDHMQIKGSGSYAN